MMVKTVAIGLIVGAVAVSGEQTADAKPMVIVSDAGGTFKLMGTPTGDVVQNGHWDSLSYDSGPTQMAGFCTAAAFVSGEGCNWARPPHDLLTIPAGYTADPNLPLHYLSGTVALGQIDTPLNFYFSGDFLFDIAALAQVTAWDTDVEFGWYVAGSPGSRSPLLTGGLPFVNNTAGGPNLQGTSSVMLTGEYGFYYMNTQFSGSDLNLATIFYTQSMFNQMGSYFSYFDAPEFNGQQMAASVEGEFGGKIGTFQQFILLNQGNTFWLGLEDQFGRLSSTFCDGFSVEDEIMIVQPCSDYDHNDLIVAMTASSVPEPATLTMLAVGLLGGAALAFKRRNRDE